MGRILAAGTARHVREPSLREIALREIVLWKRADR
jgi:hypothetical protein